jgi:hypothetical protein
MIDLQSFSLASWSAAVHCRFPSHSKPRRMLGLFNLKFKTQNSKLTIPLSPPFPPVLKPAQPWLFAATIAYYRLMAPIGGLFPKEKDCLFCVFATLRLCVKTPFLPNEPIFAALMVQAFSKTFNPVQAHLRLIKPNQAFFRKKKIVYFLLRRSQAKADVPRQLVQRRFTTLATFTTFYVVPRGVPPN